MRIHDGLEGVAAPVRFACLACDRALDPDLWSLNLRSALTVPLAERVGMGLRTRTVMSWEVVETPEGLQAHVADVTCPCGAVHQLLIGLSETQPARYQATLHHVWLRD